MVAGWGESFFFRDAGTGRLPCSGNYLPTHTHVSLPNSAPWITNTTFGDWRELSGCEQKKGGGRLRDEALDGNEGSECQAGVEIIDTSLTSEFQSGTVGYPVCNKPPKG